MSLRAGAVGSACCQHPMPVAPRPASPRWPRVPLHQASPALLHQASPALRDLPLGTPRPSAFRYGAALDALPERIKWRPRRGGAGTGARRHKGLRDAPHDDHRSWRLRSLRSRPDEEVARIRRIYVDDATRTMALARPIGCGTTTGVATGPSEPFETALSRCSRGCSSMAEQKLPKLTTRVRFPSPAP